MGAPVRDVNGTGTVSWLLDGRLHRDDGPALEWFNGTCEWWWHGNRHRVGGPVVMWPTGTMQWWISGVQVSHADHDMVAALDTSVRDVAVALIANGACPTAAAATARRLH